MPRIVVKNKAEIICEYIVGRNKINVGRGKGNVIVIDDETVSEEHCVISSSDGKLVADDLNTAFGTTVNGKKINKQEVNIGDEIGVGTQYTLLVKPYGKEKVEKSAMATNQPEAYILGIQGKMEGRKFELNPVETRIGRAKDFNDIWISKDLDKSVSRRHTTILYTEGKYVLTDRRSRNRTFINQRQVNETDEIVLKDRDEILIGKSIFRFIVGKSEDYTAPKKAGIFFIRILPKLKGLAAIVVLITGIFLAFNGMSGLVTISSRPVDLYMDNMNWKGEGFRNSWKGFLPKGTYDIIPSPAIGNINYDKYPEIVMADAMGKIYAWSGFDSALLWEKEIGQAMLTSPVLADVNSDGILDVVVGSDNSRVYVFDGISGQMLYKSSFIGGKLLFSSSPLVEDLDGDGFNDIVVVTDDRIVCFLYSPITGTQEPYHFKTPEDILSSPVVLHSNTGSDKVAIGTNGGKIYLFDVFDPDNREVIDITQKINMLKGVNLVLNEISSIPAVADLDGDGTDDLVIATGAYYIVALNIRNQSLIWAYKMRPFSTLDTPKRYASPVLTDLNGDRIPDVITGWANGKVVALNGRSGELIWEHRTGEDNRIISSLALADFNKDMVMDAVACGESGSMVILDGRVEAEQRVISNEIFVRSAVTSSPVVGDINGDGYLEIIITAVNNNLLAYTTPTQVFKNEIFWHSFRQSARNSGTLFYVSKVGKYQILTVVGFLLVVVPVVVSIVSRKKKLKRRPHIINGRKK